MEEKKSNRNTTVILYTKVITTPSVAHQLTNLSVYHFFESPYPWYLWREGVPPYLEYIEGNCISSPALRVATFHTGFEDLSARYIHT